MGCGASANNKKSVSELLGEMESALHDNPSSVSDADRLRLAHLYERVGGKTIDCESPVTSCWKRCLSAISAKDFGELVVKGIIDTNAAASVVFHNVPTERHGQVIGNMIDQVVRLETNSTNLAPALLALGARHRLYGVEPEMIASMRDTIMTVLESVLGEIYPDEERAWSELWRVVIDLMSHGMRSPAGEANSMRREAQIRKELHRWWQTIRLRQDSSEGDLKLFTKVMYKGVIHQHPEFARFSNLTDFRTAGRVMQMLTTLIDNEVSGRSSDALLRESGARHIAYHVGLEELNAFEQPFLDTVEVYLQDEYTVWTEYCFKRFWRWVVSGMVAGMSNDEEEQNAPRGAEVAIVFTDVEKSTRLWEKYPMLMGAALEKHNRIIRQLIQQYNGYEVKTIGDSFMVAFSDIVDAVLFSCCIQTELLLKAPIAQGFHMVEPTQGGGDAACWDKTTMRVRVGLEWASEFDPQYDPVHRRIDYFGPSINVAARVEGSASGGQVLMTERAVNQLRASPRYSTEAAPVEFAELRSVSAPDANVTIKSCLSIRVAAKDCALKGVQQPVTLYSVLPTSIKNRTFEAVTGVRTTSAFLDATGSNDRASTSSRPRGSPKEPVTNRSFDRERRPSAEMQTNQ